MATRSTTAAIWAATRRSTTVGSATTAAIWAATRGSTTMGPAATLLCSTAAVPATTSMGNATAVPTNQHTKRLVNYAYFMYFRGGVWRSPFLYRVYRDRCDSTVDARRLWYLVAH